MSITLRPYQEEIIENTRNLMKKGVRTILIKAPTGSGKTALTAQMLKNAAAKGMNSLFIVHRRELIMQSREAFSKVNLAHGVIASGFYQTNRPFVQVASIQTLKNRLNKINKPKLVVFDECHHQSAGTWDKVHAAFPEAFIIGLSATPARLDGSGLIKYYSHMINGPEVSWLIENGFLSKYKIYAPSTINTKGIHTRMGDFIASELSDLIDKPTITGDAIKEYQKLANGKRAIVRGVSIEHSKHIAEQFNKANIPALHVDGTTPENERDEAMESFKRGDTLILSNVDLFSEGVDVPAIECVIDLRPTQSLTLALQFWGRALRPSPDKEYAIIIDHAGNCARFGLPCDERTWSLEGRKKEKKTDDGPKIKICPECFGATNSWRKECPYCNHQFTVEAREVEQKEGELEELDIEALKKARKIEQGRAGSLEQLIAIGKERNYKNPTFWAKAVLNARKKKNEW